MNTKGIILAPILVYAAIAALFLGAIVSWIGINVTTAEKYRNKEQASDIAEAGIEYYRWHLSYAPSDYTDGTTTPAPYVHQYYDEYGNHIGTFSLAITPPPLGSSLVTVISTSTVDADPKIKRTIRAEFAIPSFAQYATVANDNMRFGAGTSVYGLLVANGGIHFDGTAYNVVESAQSTYVDPDTGLNEYGVYTDNTPADPQPPTTITNPHSDVFTAGRQYPVPAVDFVGITSSITALQTVAQSAGRWWGSSGAQGYYVNVKTNDTFDLYKVTSLTTLSSSCQNDATSLTESGWGSWTIQNKTFIGNYSFPTSTGVAFFQDNVWVDGQINTARLTIVAAKPGATSNYPSITINNNLLYTSYTGSDVLGLIAQGNINVGYGSADTMEIDGALISQNGRVGRYYYDSNCGASYIRTALTLDGMIATDIRYGFAYTDGTGYATRNINYDSNLLYAPPPSFPLASSQYSIVSWQETQ